MISKNSCKVYIALGICLIVIIIVFTYATKTSTSEAQTEAIKSLKDDQGPKRVKIEASNIHNTNALVEGDVSLDLEGSTIAAVVFGVVILVATIALASVKIISWQRKHAPNQHQYPPPGAPHPPPIPLTSMTPYTALYNSHPGASSPYPDTHIHVQRPSAPPHPEAYTPHTPHTHMQIPSAPPYPIAKMPEDPALSPLEIAVAKMITRDKENVYTSPPHPGVPGVTPL